jgi:hypothetical protein
VDQFLGIICFAFPILRLEVIRQNNAAQVCCLVNKNLAGFSVHRREEAELELIDVSDAKKAACSPMFCDSLPAPEG